MATAQQIRKAYIDYVLTNNEKPKTVYSFTKKLKITEAEIGKEPKPEWWNGIHEGLKIPCLHGLTGSSPVSGTSRGKTLKNAATNPFSKLERGFCSGVFALNVYHLFTT